MDEACAPSGVGGETVYTVPLIVTTWGGKDDKGLVFPFLHSKTLLGFICSFVLGSHILFKMYGGCVAVGQDGLQGDHLESRKDEEETD